MTINQHISTAKKRPVLTGLVAVLAVVSTGAAFAFATGMTAPQMAAAFVPLPPCCVIVPPPPPPPPPPPVVIPPVVIPEPEPLPPCCEIVPAPVTTPPVTQPPVQPPAVVVEPEPEPPIIVNPPYVPPVDVVDVIDVCLNIDGIQPSIPHGMVKKNGKCVTPEPEPAPVCTLAISRSSIDRGQSATLTWTTDNATSVRIDQGIGNVSLDGSRAVSPQSSTTYTLTATGNGKTVYCTTAITVTVVPDAPVCTLTASPSTINEGGSSTLKWTTENATSVTINQGVGSVSLNGSRAVSPQSSTTYTLTATGNGKTVNCYATVTVEKNPELPVCTLTASPTTIIRGSAATLTWTTKNATSVRIDQGIGPVSANDTRSVMPTQTTTYTLTATGNGKTVYCDTIITVIPPQEPESPVCTLTASPTQITRGGSAVLAWTTRNATSVTINQGIGQVNVNDSRTVAPQSSTTYTLTATGNGKTVYCTTAITVTVVPDAPVCTLTASPTTIIRGSAATLTWTTDHATYVVIDNHIGPVKLDDSRSVMPTQTTTYKLTATGNGKSVDCYATIVVEQPTQKVPVCEYLTASKSSIKKGESLKLSWSTRNATRVEIYPTVGVVGASDTRTVSPTSDTTYKLTAYGTGGQKDDCFATVVIEEKHDAEAMCWLTINPDRIDEGDRATIEWGGTNIRAGRITNGVGDVGASGTKSIRPDEGRYTYVGTFPREDGKGNVTCSDTLRVDDDRPHRDRDRDPKADLSFLPFPDDEPLAFVYLSDMPYTGLDLGPLGTALYWTMLVLWSGAAAYLVVFNAVPMALRRMQGTEAHGHETQAVVSHAPHQNHQVASVVAPAPARTNVARSYSSYEGFRSFAKDNGALTIDDIVSGLSREEAPAPHQAAPAPAAVAYAAPLIAPTYAPAVEAPKAAAPAVEQSDDIPGFIGALLAGDKDGAFGAIRTVTRSGGDSEEFLTQAVCALDEAYRAKLDGTECHPEIARLTKDCAPSFLERLVGSLTTAVDGTYSAGVTGVKLAVTRALSIVNG